MNDQVKPQPGIYNIKPYIGGEDIIPKGFQSKVLLSSNENPFGPSPKVVQTIQENLSRLHIYPSGSAKILKESIASFHGINPEMVMCTNGSEEGLTLLIRAFAGPGDEVVFSQYAFSIYNIATQSTGATPIKASAPNYTTDVDQILKCVTDKTKIVVIDNPSNPIGGYLPKVEIQRLHNNLRPDILLILDSAYAEYMQAKDYSPGIELVEQYENVIMTRTFSKFYALAGLRLGWLYAQPRLYDFVNRIRPPFCCNMLAQKCGVAALQDQEHQQKVISHQQEVLLWFMKELDLLNISYIPSVTNFVTAEFADAESVYLRLAQEGYIVRPLKPYQLNNHLRITLGKKEDMEKVIAILASFLNDYLPEYDIKRKA